jgi:hypothetical protein
MLVGLGFVTGEDETGLIRVRDPGVVLVVDHQGAVPADGDERLIGFVVGEGFGELGVSVVRVVPLLEGLGVPFDDPAVSEQNIHLLFGR